MYEIYRATTLGSSLQEALEEMAYEGKLNFAVNDKILKLFDNEMNVALTTKTKTKMHFNGRIKHYRLCDSVWTFVIENVTFSEMQNYLGCKKLRIVCCDAKGV